MRQLMTLSVLADNHKPRKSKTTRREVTLSGGTDSQILSIRDEDDEGNARMYTYSGGHRAKSSNTSYALFYDRQSRRFKLERLDCLYSFNLTCTPTESDATKLSDLHGLIRKDEAKGESQQLNGNGNAATANAQSANDGDGADDLFGEDPASKVAADSPPNKDNPFDYRNYLTGLPPPIKASPGSLRPSPAPSQAPSPVPTPRSSPFVPSTLPTSSRSTPRLAQNKFPTQKRREPPADPLRRPAKSRKTQPSKAPNSPAPTPQSTAEPATPIPTMQLHRSPMELSPTKQTPVSPKPASDSEDDPNGLIIEMDPDPDSTPARQRERNRRMGLGITTPGGGPISLREVAQSGSASPAVQPFAGANMHERGKGRSGLQAELHEIEDGDVEELRLGSPAVEAPATEDAEDNEEEEEDEDDDDGEDDEGQDARRRDSDDVFAKAMQEAMYESEMEMEGDAGDNAAANGDHGRQEAVPEQQRPTYISAAQEEEEESEEE